MPNNKKQRKRNKPQPQRPKKQRQQKQPLGFWQKVGRGAKTIGSLLLPHAARILGMGDYQVQNDVKVNSLFSQGQYSFKKEKVVITHSEFIGDVITGTAGTFDYSVYGINPGDSITFPWLSTIAQNFESYKIHGMVFEFKSMSADALNSTNTALGQVVLSCQYDAANQPFNNKIAQEQYDGSISVKPSRSVLFGIECLPQLSVLNQLYIRNDSLAPNTPIQFCDLGVFQISTNGFQASHVNVGELWVNYQIEFIHEKLDVNPVGQYARFHQPNPTSGLANLSSATLQAGSQQFSVSNSQLNMKNLPPGNYQLVMFIAGTAYSSSGTLMVPGGVASALNLYQDATITQVTRASSGGILATKAFSINSYGIGTIDFTGFTFSADPLTNLDMVISRIGYPQ